MTPTSTSRRISLPEAGKKVGDRDGAGSGLRMRYSSVVLPASRRPVIRSLRRFVVAVAAAIAPPRV